MTLRILGSGAAEGIPAFAGGTRVSAYALEHGGKDIRTRSGALLDGHIKLDLPPDTVPQLQRDRLSAASWSALLFTHSDDDHFCPSELQYGLWPFCDRESLGFTIYANQAICDTIANRYPQWPMDIVTTKSFEPFMVCDYKVTPIRANHKVEEDSHNFLFEQGDRRLLYATDTGYWMEETWEFLAGAQVHGLVLECTEGFVPTPYTGHIDANQFLDMVDRMRAIGALSDQAVITTTHHSHNGNATHAELEDFFGPHGIQVGFDGKEISV